jgi:hypothetical protein
MYLILNSIKIHYFVDENVYRMKEGFGYQRRTQMEGHFKDNFNILTLFCMQAIIFNWLCIINNL